MANRMKSKRSESVVTQRPPEISNSKNALMVNIQQRGRNTSLVTGNGPESATIIMNQQVGKYASSGGNGPLQYMLPYNKNSSALTFHSQNSYGNDSQMSMGAQEAFNKGLQHPIEGQPITAGMGVIGATQQQQYIEQQTIGDY